ncbi:MAG: tetratricopeptide repeat protein [Geminicoccaceae bacterium]
MAHNPDAFIREVDEDLRHERLLALWRRYGLIVIVAVVLIVVMTAAKVGWDAYQRQTRQADAKRFAEAVALAQQDNTAGALEAFGNLAENAGTGYAALARFRAAGLALEEGDQSAAIEAWTALEQDGAVETRYRQLATLLKTLATFDSAAPDDVLAAMAPLAASGGVWRHSAQELQALAYLQLGDEASARDLLDGLVTDALTPQALRDRARDLLAALGPDPAADQPDSQPDDEIGEGTAG